MTPTGWFFLCFVLLGVACIVIFYTLYKRDMENLKKERYDHELYRKQQYERSNKLRENEFNRRHGLKQAQQMFAWVAERSKENQQSIDADKALERMK